MTSEMTLYDRLSLLGSAERTGAFLEWWESGEEVAIEDFYAALRLTWSTSENVYLDRELWTSLWESEAANRELLHEKFMTADERAALRSLPTEVRIYRGFSESDTGGPIPAWWGLSWTLDRDRAVWFARRFAMLHGAARIATAVVPRQEIVALLQDRGETEVIVVPRVGMDATVESVE
jgi:hypothetical protein